MGLLLKLKPLKLPRKPMKKLKNLRVLTIQKMSKRFTKLEYSYKLVKSEHNLLKNSKTKSIKTMLKKITIGYWPKILQNSIREQERRKLNCTRHMKIQKNTISKSLKKHSSLKERNTLLN